MKRLNIVDWYSKYLINQNKRFGLNERWWIFREKPNDPCNTSSNPLSHNFFYIYINNISLCPTKMPVLVGGIKKCHPLKYECQP